MEEIKKNQSDFKPYRSVDKPHSNKIVESNKPNSLQKKDVFIMSFFGFIAAGVVFLLLLFITGVLTGYVSFDMNLPDFPGEKEVTPEETPVTPAVENITETVNETIPNETIVEEVIEEEVLPCDQDISLVLNDGFRYGLKVITLKLVSDYSAQVSVGGKSDFMDVGATTTINSLKITLFDSSESGQSATIQVAC